MFDGLRQLFGVSRIKQAKTIEKETYENNCNTESTTSTRIMQFPSSSIDKLIKEMKKWNKLEAIQNNEGTVWKIWSLSISDAICLFLSLDEMDVTKISHYDIYENSLLMKMDIDEDRFIELTSLTCETSDIAEIKFVECGTIVKKIRFLKNR